MPFITFHLFGFIDCHLQVFDGVSSALGLSIICSISCHDAVDPLFLACVLGAAVFSITSQPEPPDGYLFSVPRVLCSVQNDITSDDVNQTSLEFKVLNVL